MRADMRASFSQGQNDAGVVNARMGHYCGDTYLFTHRNPSNGKVWGENIPVLDFKGRPVELGKWVPSDQVTFV